MKKLAVAALLLPALVSLAGCAATRPPAERGAPFAPAAGAPQAPFIDGAAGRELSLSELASRAALADVVVIGELHGHPVGLPAAAALFQEIVRLSPRTTALGLEFYERDQQVHLDDYLAGVTDEEAFRQAVGKPADRDDHRPLIETARDAGLRVWALNAPRRYVRLARLEGFDAYDRMTPEQRRLVEPPESLTGGRYAETFYELMGGMGGHGDSAADGPSERLVSFFRSQNVWDATMADTAAQALDAGARPLVIIVGRFHSDFEGGLVERLREQAPGARMLTLSTLDADAADLEDADAGRADVLLLAGPMPQMN